MAADGEGAGDDWSVNRRTEAASPHRHHHQPAVIVMAAHRHAGYERTLLLVFPFVEASPVVTGSGPTLSGEVEASGKQEPDDDLAPPVALIALACGGQPLALRRGEPRVTLLSTTAVAGAMVPATTAHRLLGIVREARSAADLAELGVDAVLPAIFARKLPSSFMGKHENGCVST